MNSTSLEGYSINHANHLMMQGAEAALSNHTLAAARVRSDFAEIRSQVLGAAQVIGQLAYEQAQNRQNIHELGETVDYLEREHHQRAAEVAENRVMLGRLEQAIDRNGAALDREGAALDREGAALDREGAALDRQDRELASLRKGVADLNASLDARETARKRKLAVTQSGICALWVSGMRNYVNRVGNAISGWVNWVHVLLSKTWKTCTTKNS